MFFCISLHKNMKYSFQVQLMYAILIQLAWTNVSDITS